MSPNLPEAIAREEGREARAYPDPLSPLARACLRRGLRPSEWSALPPRERGLCGEPWTIGVGHTGPGVEPGAEWTDARIDAQLRGDIANVCASLDAAAPWWRGLDDARQDVLVQMGFQMGAPGLLRFRTTLAHLQARRWNAAADAMLTSLWARQTPARARRMAEQIRTGVAA